MFGESWAWALSRFNLCPWELIFSFWKSFFWEAELLLVREIHGILVQLSWRRIFHQIPHFLSQLLAERCLEKLIWRESRELTGEKIESNSWRKLIKWILAHRWDIEKWVYGVSYSAYREDFLFSARCVHFTPSSPRTLLLTSVSSSCSFSIWKLREIFLIDKITFTSTESFTHQKSVSCRPDGTTYKRSQYGNVEPVGAVVGESSGSPSRDQREQSRGEVSRGVDGVPGVESEAEWDGGGNDRSLLQGDSSSQS